MLNYDVVMATRNRQLALKLSVPLMLAQSQLPANFIVIDASDDYGEVRRTLEPPFENAPSSVHFEIHHTDPGASKQRNIGLSLVKSPVVFFPDDDALWYDGFARAIMEVYGADTKEEIGAVCGTECLSAPPGVFEDHGPVYSMELRDKVQRRFHRLINWIDMFFPDPLFVEGNVLNERKTIPPWLRRNPDAVLNGPMTGFRMTFRTRIIREKGFDELLGRYSLFEDRDASLTTLETHFIVRAVNALVFHHRAPQKRTSGFEWGLIHIANLAYVLCKHTEKDALSRRYLKRYSLYKLCRYLLQAHTSYGRSRVLGALAAIKCLPPILASSRAELPELYERLRKRYLG